MQVAPACAVLVRMSISIDYLVWHRHSCPCVHVPNELCEPQAPSPAHFDLHLARRDVFNKCIHRFRQVSGHEFIRAESGFHDPGFRPLQKSSDLLPTLDLPKVPEWTGIFSLTFISSDTRLWAEAPRARKVIP